MKCRNCNNKNLKKIINIGKQPLSGIFLKRIEKKEKKYSLDLFICNNCKLVQLGKNAPSDKMFGNRYGYKTSISNLMTTHLKNIYLKILSKRIINKNSLILDIGSNDGTFLNFFINSKRLFGADPSAKKYIKSYKKGTNVLCEYFTKKNLTKFFLKRKIKQKSFDLITSFAMFYDVNNPNKFCSDVYDLLSPNGVWILELSYFPLLLKNLTYDQICHEHVTYYTLTSFLNILNKNKLKVIDLNFNEINGGSIQLMCVKKNCNKWSINSKKINKVLKDEKKINYKSFTNFNKRIENVKDDVKKFFKNNYNTKIIGYGASTKGNIILNHCGVKSKNLTFICDANKSKIGAFTPGSNIKIISKKTMRIIKPKFIFVLIWSFRKEVIKQELQYLKKGGKLVFALPKFHIVNKFNYKRYLKINFKEQSFRY